MDDGMLTPDEIEMLVSVVGRELRYSQTALSDLRQRASSSSKNIKLARRHIQQIERIREKLLVMAPTFTEAPPA